MSCIAHSLQRISSKPVRSIITNKLHLMESLLHFRDGKELYKYCIYGIDLDNCDPSKCQLFEQAIYVVASNFPGKCQCFEQVIQAIASNFRKFSIIKPCALYGDPGHTFDNCLEVNDPNLKECYICAQSFKKAINDIGIKDVHTISSVSLLVI